MRQSEVAYLQLRQEIVTLVVQPGEPLSESVTAARLGISRTPVREAIQQLAQENLVTMIPDRGAFVASFSLTDIIELFQLRLALEPVAAKLAAKAPDVPVIHGLLDELAVATELIENGGAARYLGLCSRMDQALISMARNGRLQLALDSIWQQCRRMRALAGHHQSRLLVTVPENQAILEAVLAQDGQLAGELTEVHLRNGLNNILGTFAGRPDAIA